MSTRYEVGDHVSWNSEAGRVSGKIIKVHTEDFKYKGISAAPQRMSRNTKFKVTRRTISPLTRRVR